LRAFYFYCRNVDVGSDQPPTKKREVPMSRLNRKSDGQPLRRAMADAGMSIPQLAAATRAVDSAGRGVSRSIIGALVSRGSFTRDVVRLRTAWLIATALRVPLQDLFDMPGASTSTKERSIAG
jgi:hypothetical protein